MKNSAWIKVRGAWRHIGGTGVPPVRADKGCSKMSERARRLRAEVMFQVS